MKTELSLEMKWKQLAYLILNRRKKRGIAGQSASAT